MYCFWTTVRGDLRTKLTSLCHCSEEEQYILGLTQLHLLTVEYMNKSFSLSWSETNYIFCPLNS